MNRDLRVVVIILSPNSTRFERIFSRPKIGYLEGHFAFLARNVGTRLQNIAIIVWIVIYAFSRSFWAQTRLDLREFSDVPKLAPWRAILGFWPITQEITYKSWQILYESWYTRWHDHFEPKLDAIWENFLTTQNWLLRAPFSVFGPKRWKSCTNHGKYCMNRDLRVAAIILSSNSTRFERIFWRPKIGSLEGHFGLLAQNAENHVQIIANIVESWSTSARNHFEPKVAAIWETFLTAQNLLLWGPCWVFGPKRWKSCTKHGKYCMNRDLGVLAIILSPNLASISETFLTAQNCLLRGPFWVFGPKRWKSCTSHC